jgi:hypothetical protein
MSKITYRIFPQHQLIVETYSGAMTLEAYQQMKFDELNDALFDNKFNVMADLRQATFKKNESFEMLLAFISKNKDIFDKRKSAIVVNTPEQTPRAYIFTKKIIEAAPIASNLFSTVEAALIWLGIYDDQLINELKNGDN